MREDGEWRWRVRRGGDERICELAVDGEKADSRRKGSWDIAGAGGGEWARKLEDGERRLEVEKTGGQQTYGVLLVLVGLRVATS